jgi:flagellar operon protein
MSYRVINGVLYPIGNFPASNENKKQNFSANEISDNNSFEKILKSKLQKEDIFNISKHAADRLKEINLSSKDMEKINEGINKAAEKGAKKCLILYKDVALVTSIENRTIITAVEGERMKENVFTNIDSVVLL